MNGPPLPDAPRLLRVDLADDPIDQFRAWLDAARKVGVRLPHAMTLATVADGAPAARMVLLGGADERGFTFFTDRSSPKGQQFDREKQASLLFFWPEQDRQVRVSGAVERTSAEEDDAYFQARPYGSQIAATVSAQSTVAADDDELERRFDELSARLPEGSVPRPERWGGYRLVPGEMEFWQGQRSRLHDRFRYRLVDGGWQLHRLLP